MSLFGVLGGILSAGDLISTETVSLQVVGEVLDTDMGLKPRTVDEPLWFAITKLDVRAKSIQVETSEPLKPLFIHAMNRLTRKANVKLTKSLTEDEALQKLFKLHRKTGGFGVFGPLSFRGRVVMSFQVFATRTSLELSLEAVEFKGPKGEWKK